MGITELDLLLYIVGICVFLMPIALVSGDKRASGQEKNAWIIATLLLSWLGWLVFIVTVKSKTERQKKTVKQVKQKKR